MWFRCCSGRSGCLHPLALRSWKSFWALVGYGLILQPLTSWVRQGLLLVDRNNNMNSDVSHCQALIFATPVLFIIFLLWWNRCLRVIAWVQFCYSLRVLISVTLPKCGRVLISVTLLFFGKKLHFNIISLFSWFPPKPTITFYYFFPLIFITFQ